MGAIGENFRNIEIDHGMATTMEDSGGFEEAERGENGSRGRMVPVIAISLARLATCGATTQACCWAVTGGASRCCRPANGTAFACYCRWIALTMRNRIPPEAIERFPAEAWPRVGYVRAR